MDEQSASNNSSGSDMNSQPSTSIPSNATWTIEQIKTLPNLSLLSYAKLVEPIASDVEVSTGIPRLIPIVQSAHESASGNSGLARNHGNLFGITATDSWKKSGNMIAAMPTFEYINGHRTDMTREFRAYKSWRDSFFDWARLITGYSGYKKAYQLMKDPASVAEGITEMGKIYATDPAYSRSLLELYQMLKQGGTR